MSTIRDNAAVTGPQMELRDHQDS